jgi:hypothetical protein
LRDERESFVVVALSKSTILFCVRPLVGRAVKEEGPTITIRRIIKTGREAEEIRDLPSQYIPFLLLSTCNEQSEYYRH